MVALIQSESHTSNKGKTAGRYQFDTHPTGIGLNKRVGENESWFHIGISRIFNQWENRIYFPQLSDLSEHSFEISGPNLASISWNF